MAYAEAKQIAASEIPIIDIGSLIGGAPGAQREVGKQMRAAAESIGFFYVKNHGIAQSVFDDVAREARTFFARPLEEKQLLKPTDRHRGFLSIGQAKMYETAKVDLKESFIWALDIPEDDPDYLAGNRMLGPNHWPADQPGLRLGCNAFFAATNGCGKQLLRAFASSLDIADDYFTRRFTKPLTRCSAIYYPPQEPDAGTDQFGVAPHTDYGALTFVHQTEVGGLEVYAKNREWVTAHPIPGTLVVNVGDLLARWTNDTFRSTPHRVVNRSGRERISLASFVDPDFDSVINPVVKPGEAARYEPVTCGEYILGRYDKSFAYRK